MTTGQKILVGIIGVAMLGGSGYFAWKMLASGADSGNGSDADADADAGAAAANPLASPESAWTAYGKATQEWIAKVLKKGLMRSEIDGSRVACYVEKVKAEGSPITNAKLIALNANVAAGRQSEVVASEGAKMNEKGCTEKKAIEDVARWYVRNAFTVGDNSLTLAGKKIF